MIKYHNRLSIFKYSPTHIIVFGFAAIIFLGALLLSLPFSSENGSSVGFVSALFTSTSAVCVTGLVVVDTNTTWSVLGKFIILALIQIGGLGIMSIATFVSLVTGRRVGLKERLTIQESLSDFSLSGVVRTLKNILIATFIIELTGAILLSTQFIPEFGFKSGLFKSIFHSISAFCNAGFDILGTDGNKFTSLTAYVNSPVIVLTISLLIILGGLGFIVWKELVIVRKFAQFTLHTKIVLIVTFTLLVTGTLLVYLFEYNNPATLKGLSPYSKILNSFFHSVSPRTAGFNTLPLQDMREPSKLLTIILMFIGAAPGSTGGGVKVTTFSVIILAVVSYIRGRKDINVFNRRISYNVLNRSLSIFIISLSLVLISTMVLLLNNDGNMMECLYESTSAFGTVGLTTGITPGLNLASKLQIIFTMFLGRVGPLSAALIFSSRQNSNCIPYSFPEGKIGVG